MVERVLAEPLAQDRARDRPDHHIALLGAVSLALALAFGLGGRDAAARLLADAEQKGAEQRAQFGADLQTGKARAQSDAQTAKAKAQERTDGRASTGARPASA